MKKRLSVFTFVIGLVSILFTSSNTVFAQPAPSLSYLNVAAITSDGDNYVWHYPESEFLSTGYTASGTQVVLAIRVMGYTLPSSPRIFVDDVDITDDIDEPLPRENIIGPGNLIYGHIYYKAIPLDYFENKSMGVVRLFARDIHDPINVTRSTTRSFNINWNTNDVNQKNVSTYLSRSNNLEGIDIND